jgi:ribonuclease HII
MSFISTSKKSSFMSIEIEEDEGEVSAAPVIENSVAAKAKVPRKSPLIKHELKRFSTEDPTIFEIGVDEAGRGPLFGRVYCGAVILPKDDASFDHSLMKDSKKFTSKKKINEAAEYIKTHAISWGVAYSDENVIDNINILQATQRTMHLAIKEALNKMTTDDLNLDKIHLLIDGNYFKPYLHGPNKVHVSSETVEQGDNTFSSIAAASILAKVARDQYIDDLCVEHPTLAEHYAIDSNKGYGAKKHIDGIKAHGITQWHRRTFGICKNYV